MALNILHYRYQGEDAWGVVRGGSLTRVPGAYPTTGDFLRAGAALAREIAAGRPREELSVGAVACLSPVTRNQQFICQAVNYRSHLRESGLDPDRRSRNIFFRKASSCIAPASSDIVRPPHVKLLDYEIEIGLVVGREIAGPVTVTQERLHEHVAALVVVNDVSARDVQLPEGQFYKGKSYRTFGPIGPYLTLVDAADLARFDELWLRLWVNGEPRQDELARDMVFKPAPTLTELSALQDLAPGDLIATGTPGGCAARSPGRALQLLAKLLPEDLKWEGYIRRNADNPKFLKPGDTVRASVRTEDGAIDLGVQENRVVSAGSEASAGGAGASTA